MTSATHPLRELSPAELGHGPAAPPKPNGACGARVATRPAAKELGEEATVSFLNWLRPDGPWTLITIVPDGLMTTVMAKDEREVRAFVAKHNGVRNLHYAVNPLRTAMTSKARKTDVGAIEFILADLDPDEKETPEQAKARYEKALENVPRASAIIDSGNGLQVLWRLEKPISLSPPINGEWPAESELAIADAECRSKALMERLGAKAGTQNIDRILRLPGTTNLPNAKKKREGRIECAAKLLDFNELTHPLDAFPLPAQTSNPGKGRPKLPDIDFDNLPDVDFSALRVSDEIRAAIDSDGGDLGKGDRSTGMARVACELARAGLSDQEIASVLWHEPIGAHAHDQADPERAIRRAIAYARKGDAGNEFDPDDKAERQVAPVFDPWDAYVVPAFPLDIFPDVIRQFVETQSHVIGCDPTAVAMSVLGALSAALDHRFKLKMLRNGDWFASPRLWVLLVGDPSRKKTPAINAAVRALERREQAVWDHWNCERDFGLIDENAPKPPYHVVNDVTVDKLGELLSRHDRGLLVHHDEITGWIGSMERYSGRSASGPSADRAFWLRAFEGGPHMVGRIGRGEIRIKNLSVSLLGGIQPERLAELHGMTSDGLLQRFLPAMVGPAPFPVDVPTREASDAFEALVFKLAAASPSTLVMTGAAYEVATALRKRLHDVEQVSSGLARGFQGFVGKLAGMFGSVALILHMARDPQHGNEMPVDVRTVEDAARFVLDFALPHAFEFYRTAETVTDGDRLQKIASYILTAGKKRLLVSDLTRNIPMLRGLGMWDVNKLVSPFVAGGWLSPCDQGPVSRSWQVEAVVFDQFKTRAQEEERRKAALAELMNSPRGKGGL